MKHNILPEQHASTSLYNDIALQQIFLKTMKSGAQYLTDDKLLFKNVDGKYIGKLAKQLPDLSWDWI